MRGLITPIKGEGPTSRDKGSPQLSQSPQGLLNMYQKVQVRIDAYMQGLLNLRGEPEANSKGRIAHL